MRREHFETDIFAFLNNYIFNLGKYIRPLNFSNFSNFSRVLSNLESHRNWIFIDRQKAGISPIESWDSQLSNGMEIIPIWSVQIHFMTDPKCQKIWQKIAKLPILTKIRELNIFSEIENIFKMWIHFFWRFRKFIIFRFRMGF